MLATMTHVCTADLATVYELPQGVRDACFQGIPALSEVPAVCDAMDRISQLIGRTNLPPVSVGSKRASTWHKMHALVHGVFLLLGSWQKVCDLLGRVRSWTCDMGTERLLARFPNVHISSLVSWADRRPADDEDLEFQGGDHLDYASPAPLAPEAGDNLDVVVDGRDDGQAEALEPGGPGELHEPGEGGNGGYVDVGGSLYARDLDQTSGVHV